MKTRIVTLLAAFTLLFCAVGYAQTNGDVNEDGVVNEQDIESIIGIMQEAGGIDGLYYWYAGQDLDAASNFVVDDANFTVDKWHTLVDGKIGKTIQGGTSGKVWYVLTPSIKQMRMCDSTYSSEDITWTTTRNYITINGTEFDMHVSSTSDTPSRKSVCCANLTENDASETMKGDVNGDEVVDVADIASVIKIMTDNGSVGPAEYYYYYTVNGGTLDNPTDPKITPDNYTTLAPPVYELMNSLTPEKLEKGWAYLLVPNSVKSIKLKDLNINAYSSVSFEVVDESIPGHYVYKSQNPSSSGFGVFEFGYDETEE